MGEKETVPLAEPESDDEDETRSYVSDDEEEVEPAGVCTNRIYLNHQELTDLIKMIYKHDDPNYVYFHDFEWDDLVNSFHYAQKEIDGQVAIRFCQDELKALVIQHCYRNLTVEMWNDLLKKKLETITLTRGQFLALERKMTKSDYLLSQFRWQLMLASDLYMKEGPNYVGDIPIRFTFFQLATTILHRTGLDLKWNDWKDLVETHDRPLTDAFLSASLDFSMPIILPNRHVITDCDRTISRSHWMDTLRFEGLDEGEEIYIGAHVYPPSATLFD
jgi:hypothetical protein